MKIIQFIIKIILTLAGIDYEEWKKSRDGSAAVSGERSHAHEDTVKNEAEKAAEEAKKGGNDEDVFGSDSY